MSTKPKLRTAAEIISESLRPFCEWSMTRYRQFIDLDAAIIESRRTLDFSLQSAFHAFDAEPGAVANDLAERASYEAGKRLAGLLAVREVLNTCPELPAIRATLDPLFAELTEARAREADQQAAKVAAQRAVQTAEEAARADLEAKLADDPQLAAARRELEELEAVLA
jgi:hypothetical protein